MVRPVAEGRRRARATRCREALYGYLIGKDVAIERTSRPIVRAFEAFKKGEGPLPDVPFEMLTALELGTEHWKEIAKTMSWTQTRMNLNTLARHGVFDDAGDGRARRGPASRDRDAIRRARAFPYQLLAAYRAAARTMPGEITMALQEALEISIENVPSVPGRSSLPRRVRLDAEPGDRSPSRRDHGGALHRRRGARRGGVPAAQHDGRGDPVQRRRRSRCRGA